MTRTNSDSTPVYHVYPLEDVIVHDTETLDGCLCGPKVELYQGSHMVTHHSLDGRERHEWDSSNGG